MKEEHFPPSKTFFLKKKGNGQLISTPAIYKLLIYYSLTQFTSAALFKQDAGDVPYCLFLCRFKAGFW